MHQSIPAVPVPPALGNHGAFAHVVSLGGGTFTILLWSGHLQPQGDPRAFDTCVFESAMDEFSGTDEAFVEQWLVR